MTRLLTVIFSITFLAASFSYSLKVDVEEIKVKQRIEFQNYTGKHTRIYTLKERMDIGYNLGYGSSRMNIPYFHKQAYSIIHAVDTNTNGKYDADIFSILKGAEIDHIKAVRNILASYLMARYGYTEKDAELIALFVTYYNAVYRGNLDYFESKYKPVVTKHLSAKNAGLSVKYSDWPGKTRIVIPLTDDLLKGNAAGLETSELTEQKVIEAVEKKEDKGVPERKEMVELQKAEITNQKQQIEVKKQEIEQKKEEIAQQEKQTEQKKAEIKEKQDVIQKKEAEIAKNKEEVKKIQNPEERKRQETEIAKKEDQIKQEKQIVKEDAAKVAVVEKKTEETRQDIQKQEVAVKQAEAKVEKKEEAVKKEETQIKKDEETVKIQNNPVEAKKELDKKSEELAQKEKELTQREQEVKNNKPSENIFGGRLYYLKIKNYVGEGHYSNEMVIINPATRKVEVVSPFKTIGGHKYDIYKDGVVVIGYEDAAGTGMIAENIEKKKVPIGYLGPSPEEYILVLLDGKTLEYKAKGRDTVFWRSFVEVRDEAIYVIVSEGGKYYLAKFNDKLEKAAQSKEEVDENSFISFYGDSIFIGGKDRKILVLKKGDLTLEETINP